MRRFVLLLTLAGLLPAGAQAQGAGAPPMPLYYSDRPPYAVAAGADDVRGLTATPAARAFQAAGISFRWVQLPSARQLASIKDNRGPECGIGWFRNPEREAFARFSKPLYQDRPTVALAHGGFVPHSPRLAQVLESRDVVVLVKDPFSYGPYIDGLLAKLKPTITTTTVDAAQMVQMVARRRVDFMFVAEEEAAVLLQQAGPEARSLKVLQFPDMPPGEKRHVMCSRSVPQDVMDRLNAALPDL